jgi:hypothetical protein
MDAMKGFQGISHVVIVVSREEDHIASHVHLIPYPSIRPRFRPAVHGPSLVEFDARDALT